MDYYGIITKLIGPINPIGDSSIDELRFQNLKHMTILVDKLIAEIDIIASNKTRPEFSMKRAGVFADKFLNDLGIVE